MKWILIFFLNIFLSFSPLFIYSYSLAQEEDGFEDFDEEFNEELDEELDEELEGVETNTTTSSKNEADESDYSDLELDGEEDLLVKDELQDTLSKEKVGEKEVDEELDAEEFISEEVEIDEGEQEIASPEPIEKSTDSLAEEVIEEPLEEPIEEKVSQKEEAQEINDGSEANTPDLQYEANLYDIYTRFHSAAMSDEQWDYIAGAKLSEVYTIQKGDTLWDLSKTFFGDGNYWPKIWSVNSKITNPHLIETNNVIRFLLGTENEPPMFTVTEGNKEQEVAEEENLEASAEEAQLEDLTKQVGKLEKELSEEFSEAQLEEEFMSDEEIEGIVIPPPEKIIRPVTQVFPPSLPQWKTLADSVLESTTVEVVEKKQEIKPYQVALSYYIDENQPEGVGKVVGVEGGGSVASQYQYVYIRTKKGMVKSGDQFLIVARKGPLRTDKGLQEDAIIWEVQGKLTVDHLLEATKKYRSKNYDVYRAFVENSISAITLESELIRSDFNMVNLDKKGRIPSVSGLIIGGEFDTKRNLLAKESIAFLNVGSNKGVQVGDILPIYSNHYLEQLDPYVLTTKKPMGLVKIAKVTELYSTGYVVENNGSINVGDFVGLKDGFEKEYLGPSAYQKVEKERRDKELEDLQSLIQLEEDVVDPAETESYEFIE